MKQIVNYRIAQPDDLEKIFEFSSYELKKTIVDDAEHMMAIWNSRFRKEALEHYLKLGWSFIAENSEQQIQGYFLGQPILFFQGQTQTLWVEVMMTRSQEILEELIEIAYKLSKDKHIQQVIFPQKSAAEFKKGNIYFHELKESVVWAKTTK